MVALLRLNLAIRPGDPALLPGLATYAGHVADAVVTVDASASPDAEGEIADAFASVRIPCRVVRLPYRSAEDFRNRSLAACREGPGADYILLGEPGSALSAPVPAFRAALHARYHSLLERGDVSVFKTLVIRRDAPARWRGVAAEYLDVPDRPVPLDGVELLRAPPIADAHARARARDDADRIASALRSEADPAMRARYVFYLGRTLQALGEFDEARRRHLERAGMGGWSEEVYCARLYAARCGEAMGLPPPDVLEEYARLHNDMPHRAEAMHAVAAACRRNRWWERAFEVAVSAMEIGRPAHALFLEDWIYDWGLVDEVAVAAYWTGRHAEALQLCDVLLTDPRVPASVRRRVADNRGYAETALRRSAVAV